MPDSAEVTATQIIRGFRSYRTHFDALTRSAKTRFEVADWLGIQRAGIERLALYKKYLADLERRLGRHANHDWLSIKHAYSKLLPNQGDGALAETFYNSVYRHMTGGGRVNDREMFVNARWATSATAEQVGLIRTYRPGTDILSMVRKMLESFDFDCPWQDLDRDIASILRSLAEARPEITRSEGLEIELIRYVFYRNKAAHLVGRLKFEGQAFPLALPLLLDDQRRLYVDTLICDADELSVMFSFTRAYFMVRLPHPVQLIGYLKELLPNKKSSELYASVGLHKQGKTELYRGFLAHLARTDDQFEIAPGIRGMVMTVFMLPSYQTVFKVIRDRFAPQKNTTADEVREKYNIVKRHDRVGRMADTQEFQNFVFPRRRFADSLIDELLATAPSKITLTEDEVIVDHLYTERLMTPMNIVVDQASDPVLTEALDEFGNAIKQLAAANIFPGDMLLKNFGMTRHGRVVFYDYDEICYLTELNFREIPEPRTPEEEMSSEVWYNVAANDVFPEEFQRFLFGRPGIRKLFRELHGELFDAGYWRDLQDEIRAGHVMDVFPYRRKRRFAASNPTEDGA